MNHLTLGPVVAATILSRNYASSIDAWCKHLHQHIHSQTTLSDAEAVSRGAPHLVGAACTWLANELGEVWLQLIDAPNAQAREPFKSYGWMSIEVVVQDVDHLFASLRGSPFKIIGKPANLNMSNSIKAMQLIGLDGEVIYLTQIKAPVPPFDLPAARSAVDRLFIPVALVADREKALAVYRYHCVGAEYLLDTKITVINNALGLARDQYHPIALIQLPSQSLIEFDQVANLLPLSDGYPKQSGIDSISFWVDRLPRDESSFQQSEGPYTGYLVCHIKGADGETIELIERH